VALRRKTRKKTTNDAKTAAKTAAKSSKSGSAALIATLSDPQTLRRLLLAAKVVGPIVAASTLKASTGVRGVLDERRARHLGVPVEDVAAYKGAAGALQARITGLSTAVDELQSRRGTDPKVGRFVNSARTRLGELSAAATATLSMPSTTRRPALRAISFDLDQLDAELMNVLVGPPTP
jgi:hypothetical protein